MPDRHGRASGLSCANSASLQTAGCLLRDGLIERVGNTDEIESLIDADTAVVDARGQVLMPGFVDAHTHPVFSGTRVEEFEERALGATYQEIAARGGGIQSTVNATRGAYEEMLAYEAWRYSEWFLRSGTTTIEAKSGYGLSLEDELKILRVIKRLDESTALRYVPTFFGAHSVPPEYRSRREQYVSLIIDEMLPAIAQEKLAEYCDVFCEDKVFTTDEAWKILIGCPLPWTGFAHSRRSAFTLRRRTTRGGVGNSHCRSSRTHRRRRHRGVETRERAAGVTARIGLCTRIVTLSGSARDDRRWSRSRAGY